MAESLWASFTNSTSGAVLVESSPDGANWGASQNINQTSQLGPALAVFNGQLFVSFVADNSENQVLVCSTADGVNWSNNLQIGQTSRSSPSLVVFNGRLFVGFIADNAQNAVFVASSPDGVNWSGNTFINQTSMSAPALAAFNPWNENVWMLFAAFVANNSSNHVLVCSSLDGVNWSVNSDTNQASKSSPTLAAFNGKLYAAFIADNSTSNVLICSSFDGVSWTNNTQIGQTSNTGPALAVFNNQLFVAFVADNSTNEILVCSSPDGVNWTNNTQIGQTTSLTPALAAFAFSPPQLVSVPMFHQPGTQVTIPGSGFVTGTTVTFGAGSAVAVDSIAADGSSLVVTVPPAINATSGPSTITLPSGDAFTGPSFAIDTYRNTRGFSFGNDLPGLNSLPGIAAYSYDSTMALFGDVVPWVSLGTFFGFNIESPLCASFRAFANAVLDTNGQCFGLVLNTLQFTVGQLSLSAFPQQTFGSGSGYAGPQNPCVWMLNGPALDAVPPVNVSPALVPIFHRLMLAQFSQESIDNWVSFHASVTTVAGLRNAILQAFSAGGLNGIGAIVALDPEIGTGHAVVAYDIVDVFESEGDFDILVYNPDVPFDTSEDSPNPPFDRVPRLGQSVIHVFSDGSWVFEGFTPFWSGGVFNLTVFAWNTIPVQPTFPWLTMLAAGGLSGAVLWLVTGDARVSQVSDGLGHFLLADGKWNVDPATKLPNVRPMPALGGLGKVSTPAFVSNRLTELTHTISAKGAGTYEFRWLGGGCSMVLSDVPAGLGGDDSVVTGQHRISFAPVAGKAVTATVIGVGSSAGVMPRTATLKTAASAGASVALSFNPAEESFTYSHAGEPTEYTVEFATHDPEGRPVSHTLPATAIGTGEAHIFAPDWRDLASGAGRLIRRRADGAISTGPLRH